MGIKYDGSMGSAAKKALQIGGVYPYKQYEKKKNKTRVWSRVMHVVKDFKWV